MSARRLVLDLNSDYVGQLDPLTHRPFRPGDVIFVCPDGTAYSEASFGEVGGCEAAPAARSPETASEGRSWLWIAGGALAAALVLALLCGALFLIVLPRVRATAGASEGEVASATEANTGSTAQPVSDAPESAAEEATASPPSSNPTDTAVPVENEEYFPLEDCPASRLHVGSQAFVSLDTGENAIRSEPDTNPSDNILGRAQPGEQLEVIGGPVCNYGWVLWEVRTEGGLEGWTPEGDGEEYWLVPGTPD